MKLIKWIKNRPSFFFILGLIIILISIPTFIYSIRLTGGASLFAIYPMYATMLSIVAIGLDRLLVKYINPWILSSIEILVLLLIIGYFKFDNRTVFINMENSNQQYLLIKLDTLGYSVNDLSRIGLFNKQLDFSDTSVITVNKRSVRGYRIRIKPPIFWKGYSHKSHNDYNGIDYEFYTGCFGTTKFDLKDMDSIIKINDRPKIPDK